jgi:hypothetical protein
MKHYLLSVVQPAGGQPPSPEVLDGIMSEVRRVQDEMKAAGAWVFSDGLHAPSTATMLRPQATAGVDQDDEVLVTDGPFAEGKEYLAGLTIVRAADLDAALDWGRKVARATTLPIEVRPFVTETDDRV